MDILQKILNDSNYHLLLFNEKEMNDFREKVFIKETRSKDVPYIKCVKRKTDIQLKPEEVVRQLYTYRLLNSEETAMDWLKENAGL